MKIKLNVSLSYHALVMLKPEDLENPEKYASYLYFSRHKPQAGDVPMGEVEVDFQPPAPKEIVGNAVVSLRDKASELRAKAFKDSQVYETMADNLLAIENNPAVDLGK